ncbi:MAG TPA: hypothetical protein VK463_14590 [Desulfomonilaceae bacterium]|nr:hypothetical protein [Desulfomonilaceae bacterium]
MSGIHLFAGAHAFLGEIGALCFLWALVEIINRSEASLARARFAGCLGVVLLFASLFAAGYPYLVHYGPLAKPAIKAGPMPWGHEVVMEAKEHIFMFIPILALCVTISLHLAKRDGALSSVYRYIGFMCGVIVVMVFMMAGMGFIIATAVRVAVGRGV